MASDHSDALGVRLATETLDSKFKLVTLAHDATVKDALATFGTSGVYSLPVVKDGLCLGLLDLGDVVFHLANSFYKHSDCSTYEQLWNVPSAQFKGEEIEASFFSATVSSLLNASGSNPYSPLPADTTTIRQAIHALTHVRRLPLVDTEGKVVSVISQTNIIRFLGKNKDFVPAAISNHSLEELAAITRPVLTISETHRAIDAFALLATKQFSGVAITAASGESTTIGTITVKDIALLSQGFSYSCAPVEDYVKVVRQQDLHTIYPTVGCPAETHLIDAIAKFAATRLHRLLIHPVGSTADYDGVVSLGNLLRVIAKHLQ